MIMMDKQELESDAPFYAWNCITLGFNHKCDIHLIIKSEKIMFDFIKLLIFKMNTLNGIRGTAIPLKKHQFRNALQKLEREQSCIRFKE